MEYFVAFLLICSCVAQQASISQPLPHQAAQLGQEVTLQCHVEVSLLSYSTHYVWYKLTAANTLAKQCVISKYTGIYPCDKEGRVVVETDNQVNSAYLKIKNMKAEDTGTYICGVMGVGFLEVGTGTFLEIQGEELGETSVGETSGNGTTLNGQERERPHHFNPTVIVGVIIVLVVSNVLLWMSTLLLGWRSWRKDHGGQSRGSPVSPTNTVGGGHYAAVNRTNVAVYSTGVRVRQ